jgi:hypothetical protein
VVTEDFSYPMKDRTVRQRIIPEVQSTFIASHRMPERLPNQIGRGGLILLVSLLVAGAARAGEFGTSFWVWQRAEALSAEERKELPRDGVGVLYWQVGELTNRGQTWEWNARYGHFAGVSEAAMRIVPVVRLVSAERSPFGGESLNAFLVAMAAETRGVEELQIDYDCPDRLLGEYSAALLQLRRRVPRLSATALAGWSHLPAWLQLQSSVDALFPMFYDLESDPPLAAGAAPPPLLDPAKLQRELNEWHACRIPWHAGLPCFARITLYDPEGHSRGHLRAWTWADLCFNRALTASGATQAGVTLLRAQAEGRAGTPPLHPGEQVAARWPDRAALAEAVLTAKAAGAGGAIFFRLPDANDPSGWSLPQVTHLSATPRLVLKRTGAERFELVNDADGDLAPRLAGKDGLDRGYAVELDAPAPVFREALEGDFWRVTAHVDPDTAPHPVPIPLATRLTFWFPNLRAHASLRTGLLQLAPEARSGEVRYRIVPGVTDWQPLP